MSDPINLIAGRSNLPLAEKIASYLGIGLTRTETTDFMDGEFRVQVKENIRGHDVFIIQGTNPPAENLFELLMLIETARRASAEKITAVVPYYGYGRQDRKDRPRVGITAKLVANVISVAGADRIVTLDLHAPQLQGFFDIPSDHLFANPVFLNEFKSRGFQNLVMLAPDIGSVKMVRSFANSLHCGLAIVDKRRPDYNKSEVLNIIGEVEGKTVIIRDDMCDTAGTLTDAARAVIARGASEVYACCTHGLFSGKAIEKIENSPIKELWTTDSLAQEMSKECSKIKIISTAQLFGEAIRRISNKESISILFD
jgi:ribose-phosphate pyrophosphokinase